MFKLLFHFIITRTFSTPSLCRVEYFKCPVNTPTIMFIITIDMFQRCMKPKISRMFEGRTTITVSRISSCYSPYNMVHIILVHLSSIIYGIESIYAKIIICSHIKGITSLKSMRMNSWSNSAPHSIILI